MSTAVSNLTSTRRALGRRAAAVMAEERERGVVVVVVVVVRGTCLIRIIG